MIYPPMKTNFLPCRLCGSLPEADWTLLDAETDWRSYFIGCSNDLCDTMLSMEFHSMEKANMKAVESILERTWNEIQRRAS